MGLLNCQINKPISAFVFTHENYHIFMYFILTNAFSPLVTFFLHYLLLFYIYFSSLQIYSLNVGLNCTAYALKLHGTQKQ